MLTKKDFVGVATKTVRVEALDGDIEIKQLSATDYLALSVAAATALGVSADQMEGLPMGDPHAMEAIIPVVISRGVTKPKLTLADIEQMPGRLLEALSDIAVQIMEFSGLSDSAPKA